MKLILLFTMVLGLQVTLFSQTWTQKRSLPVSGIQGTFSFSLGGKLYVGGGYNGNVLDSFFAYDPSTNDWTIMPNLPTNIEASYGFSLNGMGYMVGGWTGSNLSNAVYMYNPTTNTWTAKNNFPGTARQNHVCLGANGKGYLFGGFTGGTNVVNDLWQYNDSTDSWIQLASAPGPGRDNPVGLVIANKIYLGMGSTVSYTPVFCDFYMYDPVSNAYTSVDSIPVGRCAAANFTVGNLGYVGLGISAPGVYLSDFYTFDPATNRWTLIDSFGGGGRKNSYSEVIKGIPYVGCGNNGTYKSDNWSYGYPAGIQETQLNSTSILCYPSPSLGEITIDMSGYSTGEKQISICDRLGQVVYQICFSQDKVQLNPKLAPGVYIISVLQGTHQENVKILVE